MARGDLFADELLTWPGTPIAWQQSVKGPGGGADCKGVMVGAARACGFPEAQGLYALMMTYAKNRPVPCDLLFKGLCETFDRIEFARLPRIRKFVVPPEIQRGDVLLVTMMGRPQHLAGVTEAGPNGRVVHAQITPNKLVKETRLDLLLRAYPLHSIFRWREA
jgi:cell wall-associated NlpC family hydrolase